MSQQIPSCPLNIDDSFGPWAKSCRGAFDFTLLFEETILAIPLLSFFILCWPLRMWQLGRAQVKVRPSPLRFFKAV
jgi:ATP-binding cassette, subfamily C (CFTR/MRP), member 1